MEPLPRVAKRRVTDAPNQPPLVVAATFLLLLVVSALFPAPAGASSFGSPGGGGGGDYNAYNYDLTTPMFTPDGRLLQVEYASYAASHSSPLVAVPVPPRRTTSGGVRGDGGVVLACLSARAGAGSAGGGSGRGHGSRRYTHGQRRLVEIPIGPGRGRGGAGGTSVVLGLSGVLADNLALVREVRRHVDSYHRSYGAGGRSTLSSSQGVTAGNGDDAARAATRVAGVIGDCCQSHSFGGGIRPYGATVLVCGVSDMGDVALCTAYPSGSVVRHRTEFTDFYLLGGNSNLEEVEEEKKEEGEADPSEREEEAERHRRRCCVVLGGTEADRTAIRDGVHASIVASASRSRGTAEVGEGSPADDDESEGDSESSPPSAPSPSAEFRAAAEAAVEDLLDRYRRGDGEDGRGGGGPGDGGTDNEGAAPPLGDGAAATKVAVATAEVVPDFRVAAEAAVEALLGHHDGRSRLRKTMAGGGSNGDGSSSAGDGASPAGTGPQGRDGRIVNDDAAIGTDDDDADVDVDVVLVTSGNGVHRLSGAETAALVDSIRRRQRAGGEK